MTRAAASRASNSLDASNTITPMKKRISPRPVRALPTTNGSANRNNNAMRTYPEKKTALLSSIQVSEW